MKRILFNIGRLTNGGAERVAALWSSTLVERGYDVTLYLSHRDKGEYYVDPRVKVESIAKSQKDFLAMSQFQRLKKHREYIKSFKPNVIINFLPNTQIKMLLTSMGIKGRRVETVRNNPWIDTDIGKKRPLWNLCFKKADAIIVQTDEQLEYFAVKEQKKCVVIHNPIVEDCRNIIRTEYSEKATRFMAAGRLNYQKNFPMLIEAFVRVAAKDNDIYLDIFGSGSEEFTAHLQDFIDKSGFASRITLKGCTNNICSALMQHDCFVMSSDYEGMPNALAEAMATGIVCISTDCKTGPCDMIQNGQNGYLVKTGDVDSMAEAIEKVVAMTRDQCKKMGSLARKNILELCDDEVNIKKLIDVIEG